MPLSIIRQDIVNMDVDAIVSCGNSSLSCDGGVSAAIFHAAGEQELLEACRNLAPIKTAQAVITPGFKLKSRFIIHTLGPVYNKLLPMNSKSSLRETYRNVLKLAADYKCSSIALPLISAGRFGFPKESAIKIASSEIESFLNEHEMDIYLTVYGKEDFAVSQELLYKVESYIDENYIASHSFPQRSRAGSLPEEYQDSFKCYAAAPHSSAPQAAAPEAPSPFSKADSLSDLISRLDESFSDCLLRLIDLKGKTDVEVYKKANMDRKLFSKIRSNPGYSPSKKTVLALAIALELNLEETEALLEKAGFALSHSIKFDVIVEFFIINGNYNIFEINEVLFSYDQLLL